MAKTLIFFPFLYPTEIVSVSIEESLLIFSFSLMPLHLRFIKANYSPLQSLTKLNGFLIDRAVTSPNMRENPKFFVQIAIFFFLAYVVIVSSLILTDVWTFFSSFSFFFFIKPHIIALNRALCCGLFNLSMTISMGTKGFELVFLDMYILFVW